jgi:hypothetical protein
LSFHYLFPPYESNETISAITVVASTFVPGVIVPFAAIAVVTLYKTPPNIK